MATPTQLNVPDNLLEDIRRRAQSDGISVEEQLVRDLAIVPHEPPRRTLQEKKALMEKIRRQREEMAAQGVHFTKEMIDEAKNWRTECGDADTDRRIRAVAMIQEAREVREAMPNVYITEADIRRARDEGRA